MQRVETGGLTGLRARMAGLTAAASPPTGHIVVVCAEKGGSGKSTTTEVLSIALDDLGLSHRIVECEASERLARRLGDRVYHHRLHADDAAALAAQPDLLNVYWDEGLERSDAHLTLWDLAANAIELMLRWSVSSSVRSALAEGARVSFVLLMSSDSESMALTRNSIRQIRHALPRAEVWIVLNEHGGPVDLQHPGVATVLEGVAPERILTLPACRAPRFSTLKNLGGFLSAVSVDIDELVERHGIPPLQAGRAVEGLADWLLCACDGLAPLVRRLGERCP